MSNKLNADALLQEVFDLLTPPGGGSSDEANRKIALREKIGRYLGSQSKPMARGEAVEEPTLQQVIDGFRYGPLLGSIEDRAKGIASYLERSPKVRVALDRIEGTVAHFIQQVMLDDSENFRLRGCMGDNVRFETSRFEIDMAPQNAG